MAGHGKGKATGSPKPHAGKTPASKALGGGDPSGAAAGRQPQARTPASEATAGRNAPEHRAITRVSSAYSPPLAMQ